MTNPIKLTFTRVHVTMSTLIVATLMTGCSGLGERVNDDIDVRAHQIESAKSMRENSRLPSIWIPHRIEEPVTQTKTENELALEAENYTLRGFYDEMNNLASKIAEITNIPVVVEQGITNQAELAGAAATTTTTTGLVGATTNNTVKMEFSYSGDLRGLLNLASSRFNVYWEWVNDGEKIRFFKTKSQLYRLNTMPGMRDYRSVVGKSSEASTNSSSQFESGVSYSGLDVWESVKEGIEAMLTPSGRVVASPATSHFIVTDTPIVQSQVAQFFKYINESVLKQVAVNVTVISIDTSESENFGINWNAIYSSISSGVGANLTSNVPGAAGAAQMSFNVIDGGDFNGSELFLSALRQQARIADVQHHNVVALNGRPAPIAITTNDRFLGQSSIALDGGQSVSAQEVEQFSVGLNLNVIPNIINGEDMILQLALDMSRLVDTKTIQSGNTVYELPRTESRSVNREIRAKSGSTIVITAYDQESSSTQKSGVAKWLGFLGNSVQNNSGRNTVLLLVEPVIMD
ncbi:MAG: hypothetical protein IBX55_09975 [Methyloprofundus sp.]|nr:hypothetical protein [Methyloprofundus sp.]